MFLCYVSNKIKIFFIKSQILPTRSNVISVKVNRNVNLLFISIYVGKSNEAHCQKNLFIFLKSHKFQNKCSVMNLRTHLPEGATCISFKFILFSVVINVLLQKCVISVYNWHKGHSFNDSITMRS